jgi:hypothetical protein
VLKDRKGSLLRLGERERHIVYALRIVLGWSAQGGLQGLELGRLDETDDVLRSFEEDAALGGKHRGGALLIEAEWQGLEERGSYRKASRG